MATADRAAGSASQHLPDPALADLTRRMTGRAVMLPADSCDLHRAAGGRLGGTVRVGGEAQPDLGFGITLYRTNNVPTRLVELLNKDVYVHSTDAPRRYGPTTGFGPTSRSFVGTAWPDPYTYVIPVAHELLRPPMGLPLMNIPKFPGSADREKKSKKTSDVRPETDT